MRKVIESCPACGGRLTVTRMSCSQCDTAITGQFETTIFARLSPESLAFIELFVRRRGNIKEMERELGLPYTAVRNRLDEVIGELGFDEPAASLQPPPNRPTDARTQQHRKTILARLENGELTPAEAVAALEDPYDKGAQS